MGRRLSGWGLLMPVRDEHFSLVDEKGHGHGVSQQQLPSKLIELRELSLLWRQLRRQLSTQYSHWRFSVAAAKQAD